MGKKIATFILTAAFLTGGAALHAGAQKKTAAELEKEKAMAEPFANDFGPEKIDVSKYPKNVQAGYRLMIQKCTVCHTASRPLNSQFVETSGRKKADRVATLAALKKSDPHLFSNKNVWQIEPAIWQRYVKRMMAKPGCEISKEEGKKIWKFISHDSRVRKIGANKKKWEAHRSKLLATFKKDHPERYEQLYAKHDKKKGGKKK